MPPYERERERERERESAIFMPLSPKACPAPTPVKIDGFSVLACVVAFFGMVVSK
jgi:hypothetical protein